MVEEQQLPDWLTELDGQQPTEKPPAEIEEGPQETVIEGLTESLKGPPTQPDMLDDLREQMVQQPEDDFDYDAESSSAGLLPGMEPWQGCVLAFLLFVNVAVLGCLALLVTGQVMFPF